MTSDSLLASARRALAASTVLWLAGVGDARCAELEAQVRDGSGQPVKDAVVLARPKGPTPALAPAPMQATVNQVDKEFVPFVSVIVAGSSVSFPNKDSVRHQVYSFSPARTFEIPLYAGIPAKPIVFDKPGVVTLGCNIHDWMLAYVYVADTPYFAVTGDDGKARLGGLPAGDYLVQVWHPRIDGSENATAKSMPLGASAQAEWRITLKPDLRPRRAPSHGGGGYR
jgi:plastocyanin